MQKKCFSKSYKGFSLPEMLVAMFIFSLVIGIVSQIFTQAFIGYREQKRLQSDIESAQFAINTIAKELRTASISSFSATSLTFMDYSQQKCFLYNYDSSTKIFTVKSKVLISSDFNDCNGGIYPDPVTLVSDPSLIVRFNGTSSVFSTTVGRVTIFLSLSSGATTTRLQTSVSLRDYKVSGVQ